MLCTVWKAHQCQWLLFASFPSASPTHLPPLCWFLPEPAAGQAIDLLTRLLERPQITLCLLHLSSLVTSASPQTPEAASLKPSWKPTGRGCNVMFGRLCPRAAGGDRCCCCAKQEGWQKGALGGINALAPSPPSPKGLIYVSLWQRLENRARLPEHDAGNRREFAKLNSGTSHICCLWEKRRKLSQTCSRPSLRADQRGGGWMQFFFPWMFLLQADLWSRETHFQHSKATLDKRPYWVHTYWEVWFGFILLSLLLFPAPEIPTESLPKFSTLSHTLMIPSSLYCF